MDARKAIHFVCEILKSGRYDYVDESVCQAQIEKHLLSLGVEFIKEHRLGDNGVVDFFFPRSGIALEVKASKKWSKIRVYRQCERYCQSDEVKGLVLATARAQRLPDMVNGKPVAVFNLGITLL